jgi:hypothetical protein
MASRRPARRRPTARTWLRAAPHGCGVELTEEGGEKFREAIRRAADIIEGKPSPEERLHATQIEAHDERIRRLGRRLALLEQGALAGRVEHLEERLDSSSVEWRRLSREVRSLREEKPADVMDRPEPERTERLAEAADRVDARSYIAEGVEVAGKLRDLRKSENREADEVADHQDPAHVCKCPGCDAAVPRAECLCNPCYRAGCDCHPGEMKCHAPPADDVTEPMESEGYVAHIVPPTGEVPEPVDGVTLDDSELVELARALCGDDYTRDSEKPGDAEWVKSARSRLRDSAKVYILRQAKARPEGIEGTAATVAAAPAPGDDLTLVGMVAAAYGWPVAKVVEDLLVAAAAVDMLREAEAAVLVFLNPDQGSSPSED